MLLILLLLVMLVSSSLFCDALEHLGRYFNLSAGFTASVLIGVGTATPELLVPFVAIGTHHNDIGVGAVLGSSLMLLTVAFPLCGLVAYYKRKNNKTITPEPKGVILDFRYIFYGILLIILSNIVQHFINNIVINIGLISMMFVCYLLYLRKGYQLSKQNQESQIDIHELTTLSLSYIWYKIAKNINIIHSQKSPKTHDHIILIVLQAILAFSIMFFSTEYLIHDIESLSRVYGISAFILSMVITPIATELPEKFNSVKYILKKKDTLAIGNITGALVLQTILLPVLPTLYGLWAGDQYILVNCSCILLSYLWLLFWFVLQKKWHAWQLIPVIALYAANIYFCFL